MGLYRTLKRLYFFLFRNSATDRLCVVLQRSNHVQYQTQLISSAVSSFYSHVTSLSLWCPVLTYLPAHSQTHLEASCWQLIRGLLHKMSSYTNHYFRLPFRAAVMGAAVLRRCSSSHCSSDYVAALFVYTF